MGADINVYASRLRDKIATDAWRVAQSVREAAPEFIGHVILSGVADHVLPNGANTFYTLLGSQYSRAPIKVRASER